MPLSPAVRAPSQPPSAPHSPAAPSRPLTTFVVRVPASVPASPSLPTTTPPPAIAESLYSSSSPTSPSPNHHHRSRQISPLAHSSPEHQSNPRLPQPQRADQQHPQPGPTSSRTKRRITKTRAFEIDEPVLKRPHAAARFVNGGGTRLANIPNIVYALDKASPSDPHLELLHRVLFNCAGQLPRRMSTIRHFNGFMFRSERERALVRDKLLRAHFTLVKKVAYVLDVDVGATKDVTADAILAFLEVPKVIEGRGDKAEKERKQRSERRKLERARAKAVKQRKKREEEEKNRAEQEKKRAEEEKKKPMEKNRAKEAKNRTKEAKKRTTEEGNKPQQISVSVEDSDEDGDEDLEFEALSWIELAQVRREQRNRNQAHHTAIHADAESGSDRNQDVISTSDSAPAARP